VAPSIGLYLQSVSVNSSFLCYLSVVCNLSVCHQTAGQNHYIKVANNFFKNVSKFRYVETTVTNQNCIHKEIKSTLCSGNASYHAFQNFLSFCLLSIKFMCIVTFTFYVKITIHKTTYNFVFCFVRV
jgi:hypothetical protein